MTTQSKPTLKEEIRDRYIEMWGVDLKSEVERAMVEQEVEWTLALFLQYAESCIPAKKEIRSNNSLYEIVDSRSFNRAIDQTRSNMKRVVGEKES